MKEELPDDYGEKPFRGTWYNWKYDIIAFLINIVLIIGVFFSDVPFYVLLAYLFGIYIINEYPRMQKHGIRGYLGKLHLKTPSKTDVVAIIITTVLLYASTILINITLVDDNSASHILQSDSLADPTIVFGYIVLFFLFVAPIEEYIFRHSVQKVVLKRFSTPTRVFLASFGFAVVHYPVYGFNLPATFSIMIIFVTALFLGASYEITDNLTVPTIVHGILNSLSVLLIYLTATT